MEITAGVVIQTTLIIFAVGGGSAYIKSELRNLTKEVSRLNGSIKENQHRIHETDLWKTKHIENFHAKK